MAENNPIHLHNIDHVVLRARDIAIMLEFYRDVLGCEVVKHNQPLGLYHLRAGVSMIDLVDMAGKLGAAGGRAPELDGHNVDHFALSIETYDEDAIRKYLTGKGVEVGESGDRFGAEGDGPSIYLTDPEGNNLELKGPAISHDR